MSGETLSPGLGEGPSAEAAIVQLGSARGNTPIPSAMRWEAAVLEDLDDERKIDRKKPLRRGNARVTSRHCS
jgi:hypothetical protein